MIIENKLWNNVDDAVHSVGGKKNAVTALPCVDGFGDSQRQNINKYDTVTHNMDFPLNSCWHRVEPQVHRCDEIGL